MQEVQLDQQFIGRSGFAPGKSPDCPGRTLKCRPQAQGHGGLKLAQRLETQPAIGVNHNLDRISLPINASTR